MNKAGIFGLPINLACRESETRSDRDIVLQSGPNMQDLGRRDTTMRREDLPVCWHGDHFCLRLLDTLDTTDNFASG
jgi:hypothetical protein